MTENYSAYVPEDPRDRFPIIIADPFGWSQIQFRVLEQMGYPVKTMPATMADEYKDRADLETAGERHDDHFNAARDAKLVGSPLVRAVVLEPEFTPYIEYVGFGATTEEMVPELLDLTTGQLKALDRHPVSNLLEAVDRGLPARIARYMSDIRSQGEPQTAQPIRGGVVPIAASSYVRAMDRFRSNMPSYADGSLPRLPSEIIDRHHIVRYNQLKRLGVSPVGVEALASITQDFYEMVGGFMPGFTRFRKQQRSDDKSGGSDAPYLPPSY